MTASPLVSVVTPFHNTADYLAECIESILAQSHDHFEYILVDNASTDGSSEIAAAFADRDPRIRLVAMEQLLSQVDNYNFALSLIAPDSSYCKITQADDWLYPRCLEEMVSVAERHPCAGIINSYSMRGTDVVNTGVDPYDELLRGRDVCRRFFLDRTFLFGSPSSVMYRADLVRARQPFYELGRLHEDTELCFELLLDSDFGFAHQILSYLRPRPESIMGQRTDLLPQALDRMILVERHARNFLTTDEVAELVARARAEYYEQVARRLLRSLVWPNQREFWAYQREGLATVDRRFSRLRLARGLVVVVVKGVLSPLETIGEIKRLRCREYR